MYELIQVGKGTYFINSPAKIGLYVDDAGSAVLIDSGNDKDAGRKVRQILEKQGWTLSSIVNTHSNADHIGGNQYLQRQTGCPVFTNGIETAFTKYPILETSFLYGAYPPKDLRHKFLMANESSAQDITSPDFPKSLEVIPLPGHFFHMFGVRTPDDVVFLADCISSAETLEKYGITFIYNVAEYLETLDLVESLKAAHFVPAHTQDTDDVSALTALNREKVYEIESVILGFCETPILFEHLLQKLFNHYNLVMSFEQYVLVGSTVRSYLSWMRDAGKLDVRFEDAQLLWIRV
ncbi:MAG: hypothetical protein PWQ12_913, partial [Clostridiales bacterium]|jgi:glyoxylase-like metal-dependent hydrolase (beta-lactamase superfamily II)|nr:hypothetical protein [Clostridiales bacterium]